MIIILHNHDQTLRVGHVPPATVLELAGMLSGTEVRLHVRPDEDGLPYYTDGTPVPPGDSCGRHWPNPCGPHYCQYRGDRRSRALLAQDEQHTRPADPGYFGLAVALARRTWQD